MILGPHAIAVLRAPMVPGDYGSGTVPDWSQAASRAVSGCSVQPAPSSEFTVDRDAFITRWQVFAPADADVRPTDRIEWNNDTYEVVGDVLRWEFGDLAHLVITLQRSQDT